MYERLKFRAREQSPTPPNLPQTPLATTNSPQRDRASEKNSERPVWEVEGVYIISVAARILDMHPQTLRKYERLGLITPVRTMGMLRLYSREDIRKLRLIRYLVEDLGLNLAGVELTLKMVDNLLYLRQGLAALTEGTHLQPLVEREFDQLFHHLNLPVDG